MIKINNMRLINEDKNEAKNEAKNEVKITEVKAGGGSDLLGKIMRNMCIKMFSEDEIEEWKRENKNKKHNTKRIKNEDITKTDKIKDHLLYIEEERKKRRIRRKDGYTHNLTIKQITKFQKGDIAGAKDCWIKILDKINKREISKEDHTKIWIDDEVELSRENIDIKIINITETEATKNKIPSIKEHSQKELNIQLKQGKTVPAKIPSPYTREIEIYKETNGNYHNTEFQTGERTLDNSKTPPEVKKGMANTIDDYDKLTQRVLHGKHFNGPSLISTKKPLKQKQRGECIYRTTKAQTLRSHKLIQSDQQVTKLTCNQRLRMRILTLKAEIKDSKKVDRQNHHWHKRSNSENTFIKTKDKFITKKNKMSKRQKNMEADDPFYTDKVGDHQEKEMENTDLLNSNDNPESSQGITDTEMNKLSISELSHSKAINCYTNSWKKLDKNVLEQLRISEDPAFQRVHRLLTFSEQIFNQDKSTTERIEIILQKTVGTLLARTEKNTQPGALTVSSKAITDTLETGNMAETSEHSKTGEKGLQEPDRNSWRVEAQRQTRREEEEEEITYPIAIKFEEDCDISEAFRKYETIKFRAPVAKETRIRQLKEIRLFVEGEHIAIGLVKGFRTLMAKDKKKKLFISNVGIVRPQNPKIKLIGASPEFSNSNSEKWTKILLDKIKQENSWLKIYSEEQLRIISKRPNEIILQASWCAVRDILAKKRVYVGIVATKAELYYDSGQCFRCLEYGHPARECHLKGSRRTCTRCSENGHDSRQCRRRPYCRNCGGQDSAHEPISPNCPMRKEGIQKDTIRTREDKIDPQWYETKRSLPRYWARNKTPLKNTPPQPIAKKRLRDPSAAEEIILTAEEIDNNNDEDKNPQSTLTEEEDELVQELLNNARQEATEFCHEDSETTEAEKAEDEMFEDDL